MRPTSNQATPPHEAPIYRLVVKARTGHKGYVWEILKDWEDQTRKPVQRSKQSYKTMEEAYTQGTVALNRLRT